MGKNIPQNYESNIIISSHLRVFCFCYVGPHIDKNVPWRMSHYSFGVLIQQKPFASKHCKHLVFSLGMFHHLKPCHLKRPTPPGNEEQFAPWKWECNWKMDPFLPFGLISAYFQGPWLAVSFRDFSHFSEATFFGVLGQKKLDFNFQSWTFCFRRYKYIYIYISVFFWKGGRTFHV